MPWRVIKTSDCKFTPGELARLNNIQGGTAGLAKRLDDVVGEFIGAMNAAQYPVGTAGLVPDQLRGHILARITWLFLSDFSELKNMATDARKDAAALAETALEKVANRTYGAIEPPYAIRPGGNWNSENRLIMRTHPVPTPREQFGNIPPGTQPYANPQAPGSDSCPPVPGEIVEGRPAPVTEIPFTDQTTGKTVCLKVKDGAPEVSGS